MLRAPVLCSALPIALTALGLASPAGAQHPPSLAQPAAEREHRLAEDHTDPFEVGGVVLLGGGIVSLLGSSVLAGFALRSVMHGDLDGPAPDGEPLAWAAFATSLAGASMTSVGVVFLLRDDSGVHVGPSGVQVKATF